MFVTRDKIRVRGGEAKGKVRQRRISKSCNLSYGIYGFVVNDELKL
jgi:hypothetical protein